jgi:hypothetical protein
MRALAMAIAAVAGCGATALPALDDQGGGARELGPSVDGRAADLLVAADLAVAPPDAAGADLAGLDLAGVDLAPPDLAARDLPAFDLALGGDLSGRPVGAACNVGADCQTGQCDTFAIDKLFQGGYCTVFNCDVNRPCPAGSTCKSTGFSMLCVADCDPTANPPACRTNEGYACCGAPMGGLGSCWPTQAPACM